MTQRARLRWNGAAAMRGTRAGAVRGLRIAAEHVLADSRKVVPIEEATLERSGVATVDESSLTAAVSYDTPYAIRQHEELNYRHDAGRSAKYLERPLTEQADTVAEIIAAQLRRSLRG
ncbi:minor capsid protein [Streptomyces sp. NBC_01142]|uniref:minor capsid protein n=1 Tax=Streptomyces sp. NBC_01142 TaxID=2975865 RepID=UPI002250CCBC|nr:minor capsid protein [Streptomyces sp. NBC_01142]MCX4824245.1 minor capsid protein [Streptomyces sp. NBC_01142]